MAISRYAVLGYPLGHTMSPFIHEKLFAVHGVSAAYEKKELPPQELPQALAALRKLNGFNLTIPHKSAILPFLDRLDDRAALYGAVNTVKCNDSLIGYNTDYIGFLRALEDGGVALSGSVLLCGAGGAAHMMAFEAASAGCSLTIAARPSGLPRARGLAEEIRQKIPGAAVGVCTYDAIEGDFDLLLNATPAGMYPHPEAMPVNERTVRRCRAVFDAIYNPRETMLLHTARLNGSKCAYGMPMLVWQAAAAQEIWNGLPFTAGQVAPVIEEANWEMERVFR